MKKYFLVSILLLLGTMLGTDTTDTVKKNSYLPFRVARHPKSLYALT